MIVLITNVLDYISKRKRKVLTCGRWIEVIINPIKNIKTTKYTKQLNIEGLPLVFDANNEERLGLEDD